MTQRRQPATVTTDDGSVNKVGVGSEQSEKEKVERERKRMRERKREGNKEKKKEKRKITSLLITSYINNHETTDHRKTISTATWRSQQNNYREEIIRREREKREKHSPFDSFSIYPCCLYTTDNIVSIPIPNINNYGSLILHGQERQKKYIT